MSANGSNGSNKPTAKDGTHRGRPKGSGLTWTADHAQQILLLLKEGVTLNKACQQVGPSKGLVLGWALGYDDAPIADFVDQFARATRIGWESISYDLIEEAESAKGQDMAMVVATKNKMDVVKWLLARRVPDQFGDRLQIANTGGSAQIHIYLPGKPERAGDGARVIEGSPAKIEDQSDD